MYSSQWVPLDNVAKIIPPATSKTDSKVFRFACELHESVDGAILQNALDASLDAFPYFRSIIRRGLFWYYFEKSDLPSIVQEEYKPICAPLYDSNRKNLLFELSYYRKRINLEVYHALSDGMGALQFLKTIICNYLSKAHPKDLGADSLRLDTSSDEQQSLDAFNKYFSKAKFKKIPKLPRAFKIKGERFPESRLGIIEGYVSVAAIKKLIRTRYGTAAPAPATIGEFLCALFICSIHDSMTVLDEARPVSITVPIDLRKFFQTLSTRNFFSVVKISHNFSTQGKSFEAVLRGVQASFKQELDPARLQDWLNQYSSLDHNMYIRVVPLAVKFPVLRGAAWKAQKYDSGAFSNLGRIQMPPPFVPYIRLFDVLTSTKRPQICVNSFEDTLVISFSSPFMSSNVQRCFFRALSDFGLDVEIVSNLWT
ncbi:hypothetical protein ACYULU_00705 [Breznakiellaceae bacterium SP9]